MKQIDRKNHILSVPFIAGFAAFISLLEQYGFYLNSGTLELFRYIDRINFSIKRFINIENTVIIAMDGFVETNILIVGNPENIGVIKIYFRAIKKHTRKCLKVWMCFIICLPKDIPRICIALKLSPHLKFGQKRRYHRFCKGS
jgi:hypothetical protein